MKAIRGSLCSKLAFLEDALYFFEDKIHYLSSSSTNSHSASKSSIGMMIFKINL